MEQEKMMNTLQELNSKLNKSSLINEKLLMQIIKTRRDTVLQKRINYNILCTTVCAFATIMCLAVMLLLPDMPKPIASALILPTFMAFVCTIFNILVMGQLYDMRDESNLKALVAKMMRYRQWHKYGFFVVYAPAILVFPCLYCILNVPFHFSLISTVVIIIAAAVEGVLVMKSINRGVKNLLDIEQELNEMGVDE